MLRTLSIKNFQSHKDSTLEFHPNVNVIVGLSDSGKSAIIRSLRWLIWNRPSGDSIRSKWGGETSVHLETDTDKIVRWRHDYENAYRFNTQMDFKAIKSDVPEEIVKALNISEINLQRQLDAPFLLSSTPGEVAQHFNRVANLDKIDTSIQKINGQIRELTNTIKFTEQQIEKQKEELKQFEHLEKFEMDVEVLEELDKRRTNKLRDLSRLKTLFLNIQYKQKEIDDASGILKLEPEVNKILQLFERVKDLSSTCSTLQTDIKELKTIEQEFEEAKKLLSLETYVNNLLRLYSNVDTVKSQRIALNNTLSQLNNINVLLTKKTAEIARKQAEFKKGMGKVCILCGQPIKE